MLKNKILSIMLIGLYLVGLSGCVQEKSLPSPTESQVQEMKYEQISQSEAKQLMDTEENYIILDVRTEEEFAEGHINGAILIPDYEISEKADSILKDKDQLILVYCRSGRRSKLAAEELANLGYTNVKEFGGIIDWKHGDIVK
jgi:rhodanese-related sulfurtransferase